MTRLEDRQTLMRDIAQACAEGSAACPGLCSGRHRRPQVAVLEDRRSDAR